MKKPLPPPYGEIRVTLPKFLIILLRDLVKKENDHNNDPRWTVSQLLESFLFEALSRKELEREGKASAEFRREAEAWLRWIVSRKPERRYRK